MSAETRRQEQDVKVYRCDLVRPEGQCVRETAFFHAEGHITVLLDPAWVIVRVGLGEEKHFCSWDHFATWTGYETMGAIEREEGAETKFQVGESALRLRAMDRQRQEREELGAEQTRASAEARNRTAELLETI